MRRGKVALAPLLLLAAGPGEASPASPPANQVVGTWRMVSATLAEGGRVVRPYGDRPAGMLVFTAGMHFVEVLTDPRVPRFASDERGRGPMRKTARR